MVRRKERGPGTFKLLAKLPGQAIGLAKLELDNAKREITSKVILFAIGLGSAVVALFFLYWAIPAFGFAAIAGLASVMPWWLAALIIALVMVVLAIVAVLAGVVLIKKNMPVPKKTIARVREDLNAASEVKTNRSAHATSAEKRDIRERVKARIKAQKQAEGKAK